MNVNIVSDTSLMAWQLSGNEPPKNKLDKVNESILNKEDDNSYEEPVTDNTGKQTDAGKESMTQKNFEYIDDGEFKSDKPVADENPGEEFL